MKQNKQIGLTLIEVLVSLAILSVGIVGMASMQMYTNSQIQDQNLRNLAIWKVDELATRISINSDPAAIAQYNTSVNDVDLCLNVPTVCEDSYQNGAWAAAAECTPTEMAIFDSWTSLCDDSDTGALVRADATLECLPNCDGVSPIRLTVAWRSVSASIDPRLINEDDSSQFTDLTSGDTEDSNATIDYYRITFQP